MELDIQSYKLKIGSNAIDFNLKGTDGKTYSLRDSKGKKAAAVIFTCNHCPYAKAYEDRIVALQGEFKSKGVSFVAINANDAVKYPQDSFENMKIRAKEKNFNFPYLYDETQGIARKYGAQVTPEIFLFDENLKLVYHGSVDNNMEHPEKAIPFFRNAIIALLNGEEIKTEETSAFGCSIKWK